MHQVGYQYIVNSWCTVRKNIKSTLRNIPEERRSDLRNGRSLKSCRFLSYSRQSTLVSVVIQPVARSLITSTPTFRVSVYKLKQFSLFTLLVKPRRRLTGTYTTVNYRHLIKVSHVCDIINKRAIVVSAAVNFRTDPDEERGRTLRCLNRTSTR